MVILDQRSDSLSRARHPGVGFAVDIIASASPANLVFESTALPVFTLQLPRAYETIRSVD